MTERFPHELPEGAVPMEMPIGAPTLQGEAATIPNWTPRQGFDVVLPDGRRVGMAPLNISISRHMASILKDVTFADPTLMMSEQMKVKALLCVTAIDGHPVDKPLTADARYMLDDRNATNKQQFRRIQRIC